MSGNMKTPRRQEIFSGDNGRVLGYDNSHGFSHRHHFGVVTPESFTGYEALYERFEREWQALAIQHVNRKRK